MSRTRRRTLFFSALLLLSSALVVEVLCRGAEARTDLLVGPYEAGGADGGIGFGPGAEFEHEGVLTTFNDGAYVGPIHASSPPPGVTRIVVLGDSFTFGWAVGADRAWPALVDAALGPDVEVLNFAVPGQNTWLQLEHYRRNARRWGADLVLLGWYINDAAVDRRSPNVHRLCPLPAPGLSRPWALAMEVSAAARVAHDLALVQRHGSPLPPWDSDLAVEGRFGFDCSMHWLEEIAAEVAADGADFAVVPMPHLASLDADSDPERDTEARVLAALAKRGLRGIPLYEAVAGQDPERMQTHDLHPSAAAHERMGRHLTRAVAELLPRR